MSQSQNLTYTWTPTNAVSNPLIANPTAVVQTNTLYIVVVEDRNGCSGLDSVLVEVKPFPNEDCMDENIFLPNGFSPNGDTKNDIYYVKSKIPLTSLLFIIYNRWGEKCLKPTTRILDGMEIIMEKQPLAIRLDIILKVNVATSL
ncbi:MAG: gliding motility-associated C-terminal domain-containing protein [Bacteroidetes bacterium]|nr:gliding motility-associated C-terminal domain-containing protein [Bacteroidota bacterium]